MSDLRGERSTIRAPGSGPTGQTDRLSEIRERHSKATPGRWWLWSRTPDTIPPSHHPEHTMGFCGVGSYERGQTVMPQISGMTHLKPADAELLECAVDDIGWLLAECERLRALGRSGGAAEPTPTGMSETIATCEAAVFTALETWSNTTKDKRTVDELLRDVFAALRLADPAPEQATPEDKAKLREHIRTYFKDSGPNQKIKLALPRWLWDDLLRAGGDPPTDARLREILSEHLFLTKSPRSGVQRISEYEIGGIDEAVAALRAALREGETKP